MKRYSWIAIVLCAAHAEAAARLPHIFSDGMILQRDAEAPIWGWADPGEPVTVEFAGQSKSAKADASGNWEIGLDPMSASDRPRVLRAGSVTVSNVLVGDVFLCSGQSNMALSMNACRRFPGTTEDIDSTDLPDVAFFQAPNATFREAPQDDVDAKWEAVSPENNAHLSAVAFYFARSLHEHLHVPIGIIRASHAGGQAETKMPKAALLSVECGRRFYETAMQRASPEAVAARNELLQAQYETALREAMANGTKPPEPPKPSRAVDGGYPCGDWNGVIAPVIRYAKRGIVWYQGEHNARRAFDYRELLPALIRGWREASGRADMPFILVQLPAYDSPDKVNDWPMLRESQWVAFKATTNTAMVVTIDHGEKDNIHPPDKKPIGERIALEARRLIYGEKVTGCGPLVDGFAADGTNIVVRFTGNDLKSVGGGFTIAGEDRKFVPATAAIRGNTVILNNPAVSRPVAARYAWEGFPTVSLFDVQGLPASPFRTDGWK